MKSNHPREGQKTLCSQRPWGNIYMVVRNLRCSVDLTTVNPGHRTSLHSHAIRTELFHFLDDGAYLELDGNLYRPVAHEEFLIAPGVKHRFWAGENPFHMLVVCFGEWQAEDQVRHEDDYGRKGEALLI